MGKKIPGLVVVVLAATMFVFSSAPAEAAFTLYVCNDAACTGGDDTTLADADADGLVVFAGVYDGFSLVIAVGQSKPFAPGTPPSMDLGFILTSAGAADAWIYASDTDWLALNAFLATFGGTTDAVVGTITGGVFGGDSNSLLDLAPTLVSFGPFSGPFAASATGVAAGPTPYSLTLGVHVTHSAGAITSGDLRIIPEPASIALFGLGLVGFGLAARRRTRRS